MVSFDILVFGVFFLVVSIHLESVFYLVFRNFYILHAESLKRLVLSSSRHLNLTFDHKILVLSYMFILLPFKSNCLNYTPLFNFQKWYFITFCLFAVLMQFFAYTNTLSKDTNPFLVFGGFSLFFLLMMLSLIQSYLIFFFFLEVISVYYYFFFLSIDQKLRHASFIKYKNFILYFLWNSFFTSICAGASLGFATYYFGSTSFSLLNSFNQNDTFWCMLFFFLALVWKLGIGGFHFLKLEVYLYLDLGSVIYFSSISLFINLFVFVFFILQPSFLLCATTWGSAIFILFFFINIVIFFCKLNTLPQFFGVSSIVTLITAITMLVIG